MEIKAGRILSNVWAHDDLDVQMVVGEESDVCDGEWHHIVATFDGVTRAIYVDGITVGEVQLESLRVRVRVGQC